MEKFDIDSEMTLEDQEPRMKTLADKYELLRTIGVGASCKVKLAVDMETKQHVAIKILNGLDQAMEALIMNEVQCLGQLSHPNILSIQEFGVGEYKKGGKTVRTVTYIVLDLASTGELFDVVLISGPFSEKLSRFYFTQFLDALEYCHSYGIVHRDIKAENLLLDEDFNLKVADFGFAGPAQGRDESGMLTTKLGTTNYMAPEIHAKNPKYNGKMTDLFASAIILFTMRSQNFPFSKAKKDEALYKCIVLHRADLFWSTHS